MTGTAKVAVLYSACYSTPVDASAIKVDQRAEWLAAARKVMETEAQAILAASRAPGRRT